MIRPATAADAPAIGSMHAQAWQETYPGLVPPALLTEMTDPDRRRAAWARTLAAPLLPGGILVLEQDGAVRGFIAVCAARDAALGASGEVSGLYLLRAAQGRGLGRALLAAGATVLLQAGHDSAGAWALDANTRAAGFYAATGAIAGTRQTGWHGPVALEETAWVWPDLRGVTS
ncbi:GNAT family N-acetyltransferase [Falsiroseomonas selenitidurans]|uniref:GNAT family N-acetyltransferase n=1 Tax=Falsiroseomonas selenitidurans TaxID=2716335 RepID=A0ABX1E563_9PROT|nr:GNAT family N-acetyltransferase [Falsiroseomonas selenitidurans]NKC32319.1 GNAT family N-acetyltransferase [Falsiroseomonas selenitidurans]